MFNYYYYYVCCCCCYYYFIIFVARVATDHYLHVIFWQKTTYLAKRRNFTLFNLQRSAEYCVQIQTLIRINNNTRTSDWTCVFSSSQQPSRGWNLRRIMPVCLCVCLPVHLCFGAALAMLLLTLLGLLVLVALMTFIICLHHTGFLCRLKALLPRALVVRNTK